MDAISGTGGDVGLSTKVTEAQKAKDKTLEGTHDHNTATFLYNKWMGQYRDVMDAVDKAATAARAALQGLAQTFTTGIPKHNGGLPPTDMLPFQRRYPLIPGVGAKQPPYPGDKAVNGKGTSVRSVQELLKARGWNIEVDGKFGPQTRATIMQFQRNKGISPANGVVDEDTWKALWTKKVIW